MNNLIRLQVISLVSVEISYKFSTSINSKKSTTLPIPNIKEKQLKISLITPTSISKYLYSKHFLFFIQRRSGSKMEDTK